MTMSREELLSIGSGSEEAASATSATAFQNNTADFGELEQLHRSYKEDKYKYGTAAQKGLASNIAGLTSLVPDALREAYYLVKSEDMPEFGYGKGFPEGKKSFQEWMTTDVTDARLRPEAAEGEKAMFYGAEGLPVAGVRSMVKSGLGMTPAVKQTVMDVGTSYVAGRVGEENPWLGLLAGAGLGTVQGTVSPYGVTKDQRMFGEGFEGSQREQMQSTAAQMKADYGITETKGMAMWRAADKLPAGLERDKARAKALRLLMSETAGRKDVTGKQGSLNAAQWLDADEKRMQELEFKIRELASIEGSKDVDIDLTAQRNVIYDLYKVWKKEQYTAFKNANEADFGSIDKSARFSAAPTVQVLNSMLGDPELSSENKAMLRTHFNKFVKFDEDGNIEAVKSVNAEDIKDALSEYSAMAYGRGDKFSSMPKGKQTYYGSQLLSAMNETLDSAGEVGEALKQARANFSRRVTALQENANRPLIRMFDEMPTADPKDLANVILMNSSDNDQMEILRQVLTGAAKDGTVDPNLLTTVKEQVFRQAFTATQVGKGDISLSDVVKNIGLLQDNRFFFDSKESLMNSKRLFKDLDGLLASAAMQGMAGEDLAYLKGKMSAEALGAISGAKGRYVGELAVKAALMQRLRKLDADTLAKMANDPNSTAQIVMYLKGKGSVPNTAQIKAAQNVGLIDWVQQAAQVNSMFQRKEAEEKKKETAEPAGLFSKQ